DKVVRHGLEGIDGEPPGEISRQHEFEAQTRLARERRSPQPKAKQHDRGKQHVVNRSGMARDTVAEIDAPGQRGGRAVGVIVKPGEQAPDASNDETNQDGRDETVAGRLAYADDALGDFDTDESAQYTAHDGLPL